MVRVIAVFLLCFAPFLVLSPAYAQRTSRLREELEALRKKIEVESNRLAEAKAANIKIQQEITRIEKETIGLKSRRTEYRESIANLAEQATLLQAELAQSKGRIRGQQQEFSKRIVAIYKMHRQTTTLDYLFRAASVHDLMRRAHLISMIASSDRRVLNRLGTLIDMLESERAEIDDIKEEQKAQLKGLDSLEARLKKQRTQQAKLLRKAGEKTKIAERSLVKLKGSALRLERMLGSLMGRKDDRPTAAGTGGASSLAAKERSGSVRAKPFRGVGLRKLKGKLELPVKGKLVQRYGRQRHEDFSDIIFVKGVEFLSPVGSKVTAIAPGRVIFADVLPGYGNVIILDHGKRYYSLYGRLATTLRRVGEEIGEGEDIAVLGQADAKKRNFYFELRVKGKAVNPMRYFKR